MSRCPLPMTALAMLLAFSAAAAGQQPQRARAQRQAASGLPADFPAWAHEVGARTTPRATRICRANDQGARPDTSVKSTQAIQQAIDECAAAGGGVVFFAPGGYLTGALFLKSNVHLRIDRGVTLFGSHDDADYPERPTRVAGIEMPWPVALINVDGQRNVRISGGGTIDGRGQKWWDLYWTMRRQVYEPRGLRWAADYDAKRVRLLVVSNAADVTIDSLHLKRSGFWTVQLLYSEHVTVDGLTISDNQGPSTDGIDIDSSHHILVRNNDIDNNDDTICLKAGRDADGLRVNRPTEYVLIRDNLARRGAGVVSFGSETSGGIRHIIAWRNRGIGTSEGIRFKSARTRGGFVEDVLIRDLKLTDVPLPVTFTLDWNPSYSYATYPDTMKNVPEHWVKLATRVLPPERGLCDIHDIRIEDVTATGARRIFTASGLPGKPLRDVAWKNVTLAGQEAGSIDYATNWSMRGVTLETPSGDPVVITHAVRVDAPRVRAAGSAQARAGGARGQADARLPAPDSILADLRLANRYFVQKWPDPGKSIVTDRERASNIWTRAVYYEGLMALYRVDPRPDYYAYAVAWGDAHHWDLRDGNTFTRNADNQAAGQTYIDLYRIDAQPERVRAIRASIDSMLATSKIDDWTWIDAIQMAMPVFARLGVLYHDNRYLERMYEMYRYTRDRIGDDGLFNARDGLWWRDKDFTPPHATPAGKQVYWSRGNGWVLTALARVLDVLPPDAPHRDVYIQDFRAMARALPPLQRPDGFWNVSLVDSTHFGGPETSGTAMFAFGLAWGINHGLLDAAIYRPVVVKAWRALSREALQPNGFLGFVQGTGKQPSEGQPVTRDHVPDFEDYALGAFLMAGSEVYRLAGGKEPAANRTRGGRAGQADQRATPAAGARKADEQGAHPAPGLAADSRARPAPAVGAGVRVVPIGSGWARSSVNAVIFRQYGLVTHDSVQYTAFYDDSGRVVLAKRGRGDGAWVSRRTQYRGNVQDAHNAISLGVDGAGVLHVSWDLHGDTLRYARSEEAGALELLRRTPMTGQHEARVTYPQFYALPGGDLLFVYRDGSSGAGDVMLDRYDTRSRGWRVLSQPLIDGAGQRNAYVNQLAIDDRGGWHLSWTWRETPDVASNHDILYAYSPDQGVTWQRSTGERYTLPITAATAEVAQRIAQGSGLINQTTMTVDDRGHPFIATYWRDPGSDVPQYRLVWYDGSAWRTAPIGRRTTPFRLEGAGTRRVPMSRPLVLAGRGDTIHVVFRDLDRGPGIFLATSASAARNDWRIDELYASPVGYWEPVHDPVAWKRDHELDLLVQKVGQGQGETLEDVAPQTVAVLEWRGSAASSGSRR